MSTAAILMMIVALLAVWGGLGLALLNLKRHPEDLSGNDDRPAGSGRSGGDDGSSTSGAASSGTRPSDSPRVE